MGVRLLVEVLDHAPADLTPAERLVLAVLAEDARDETRLCWPGKDKLVHRTGLKPDSLRKVFQRLAKRGFEVRVPITYTEKGAPVFAREGVQTNYRLPVFPTASRDVDPPSQEEGSRDDDPASEEGPPSPQKADEAGPSSRGGGTVIPFRRDPRPPQEAGPSSPPSPQPPSTSPHTSPHNAGASAPEQEDPEEAADGGLFPTPKPAAKKKQTPKKPEPGSDNDPEFVAWWDIYPKKANKGTARRAWKKARAKASLEELIQGVHRYMELDPHYARGFVKDPGTWLNGEAWANEYTPQPPQQAAANGDYQPYTGPQDTSEFEGDF